MSKVIATFLGAGYSPVAPGTVGAAYAVALIYAISCLDLPLQIILGACIIIFYFIGVWASDQLSELWPHDDNRIVIDEALGIFVSFLLVPIGWTSLLLGFIIFRVFDIFKPFGIRRFDKMNTSHGVMLDDLLAGVYTNIVLQVIFRWIILTP